MKESFSIFMQILSYAPREGIDLINHADINEKCIAIQSRLLLVGFAMTHFQQ